MPSVGQDTKEEWQKRQRTKGFSSYFIKLNPDFLSRFKNGRALWQGLEINRVDNF